MKLLLDQNISRKLVKSLARAYPGTSHVYLLGLQSASDLDIWEYAQKNSFVIVTQDSDFSERIAIHGHPPKVIWLRMGNTSTQSIESLLLKRTKDVKTFEKDTEKGCLVLW
jgi:predicted nuclease of predicted toxin-antitoxin system